MFNVKKQLVNFKNNSIKNKINYSFFFVFILSIAVFIIQMISEYAKTGYPFAIKFFQMARSDVFFDFYHVNDYVKDNNPYFGNDASYPPLVLAFAKLFVPQSNYESGFWDMLYQPSAITSLVFFYAGFITPMIVLFFFYFKKKGYKTSTIVIITLCFLLSASVIYNFERANYIFYALLFCFIFYALKDSKNAVIRELSLISLSIAVGIKLYPALFASILLKEKRFGEFIRCACYSVLMCVVPFFFFENGLMNLGMFFSALTGFSNGFSYDYNFSIASFAGIVNYIFTKDLYAENLKLQAIQKLLPITTLCVCLILSLFTDKKWKNYLLTSIVMITFPNVSYKYCTMFLLVPLLAFIEEENKCNSDWLYALFFAITLSPLYLGQAIPSNGVGFDQYYVVLTLILFIICFAIEIFINLFKNLSSRRKAKTVEV